MTRHAVAIRHIHFEDLGTFAPALTAAGYAIRYVEAVDPGLDASIGDPDLLIVLGGPIGAYEATAYPFLGDELTAIRTRLDAGRPMLGICLGAQLIASALCSRVYPGGCKEIGWGPIAIHSAGESGPLRHLDGIDVLHWHGDTFDLPLGCDLLASTELYANQAFSRGSTLLALQFHPEVDGDRLESWLVGHACELAVAGIDPAALRQQCATAAPHLHAAGAKLIEEWLQGL